MSVEIERDHKHGEVVTVHLLTRAYGGADGRPWEIRPGRRLLIYRALPIKMRSLLVAMTLVIMISIFYTVCWHLPLTYVVEPVVRPLLIYAQGIATVLPKSDGTMDAHPILELIARGKAIREEQDAKRALVDSLDRAVADYVLAFGMDPPEGFDRWYVPS
jgi:hypothetical protein